MSSLPLNATNTKAQMRKGLLEFCLLLIISQEKAYANDILRELRAADLIVVEGTIYPILNRLKDAGLLAYDWSESKNGPPRKYYHITQEGKAFLAQLLETWNTLQTSISTLKTKFA